MNQSDCAKSFNAVNVISYVKNLSTCAILSFIKELETQEDTRGHSEDTGQGMPISVQTVLKVEHLSLIIYFNVPDR